MSALEQLKVNANAKINLTLSVKAKRSDGYHELDTVMQSVSIFDTLTVRKSSRISVSCEGICSENNIAYSAAKLFFKECNITGGAEIEIEKHIPEAAGLGGGSADAAAVLAALDKLYNTNLSYRSLCGLAVKTGADVPFLLRGGTQRAGGIGEILTPVKNLRNVFFVIAKAGTKSSTAEMFSRLDNAVYPRPRTDNTIAAIENRDFGALAASLGNSFSVLWQTAPLENKLTELGAAGTCLSGSGPAVFALFSEKETALSAVKSLKATGTECYFAEPLDFSLKFE